MNNEEKILLMLEQLQQGQVQTNERLGGIDKRLEGIDDRLEGIDERLEIVDERLEGIDSRLEVVDERLDGIDTRLDNLEQRVVKIEMTQENEVIPNIKLLAEAHGDVVYKLRGLDKLDKTVDDMQSTIFALKIHAQKN